MVDKEKLKEFLKQRPELIRGQFDLSAKEFGENAEAIRYHIRQMRIEDSEIADLYNASAVSKEPIVISEPEPRLPKHDLIIRREQEKSRDIEKRYKILLGEYESLNEAYDDVVGIKDIEYSGEPIISGNPGLKTEATALVIWSDFHLAEKVELGTSMGLNKTNPEIMKRRVQQLAINTLRLVEKERQDVVIEDFVLALLGDFMNAFLHEWDVQQNYMSPIEELIFARDLLLPAIHYIVDNGNFKRVTIVCQRGNHPRLGFRMSSSTDYKMNYEALLYNMIRNEFENSDIVDVHTPESEIGYLMVYGLTIRYIHGQQIRFAGGVGGIGIPLQKQIYRWDHNRRADLTLMGHYHQFSQPANGVLLNGSLVGFNSYANSLGFPFEVPTQTFQLIDKKYGMTTRMPIFCE